MPGALAGVVMVNPMNSDSTTPARREDLRLITGCGQYVSDHVFPGMLYAVFVRSSHAHARMTKVNKAAAAAAPGVVCVLRGGDLGDAVMPSINPLAHGFAGPVCPLMAGEIVKAVGQPIAMVVARSLREAESAAELVSIEYQPLPVQADHDANANPVTQLDCRAGDAASAARTAQCSVTVLHRQPRVNAMAMEPRAIEIGRAHV